MAKLDRYLIFDNLKVIFYSNDIFEDAGLTGSWPTYATILLGECLLSQHVQRYSSINSKTY